MDKTTIVNEILEEMLNQLPNEQSSQKRKNQTKQPKKSKKMKSEVKTDQEGDHTGETTDQQLLRAVSQFYLGQDACVEVTEWRGETRVDIRQYQGGYRTKKGVSLTPSRFRLLVQSLRRITDTLEEIIGGGASEYEYHLGGNVWVYAKAPYQAVQIRKKFLRQGVLMHSPYGISLKSPQWQKLCEATTIIDANFPDIATTVPCIQQEDHRDQISLLWCLECCPNSYY